MLLASRRTQSQFHERTVHLEKISAFHCRLGLFVSFPVLESPHTDVKFVMKFITDFDL